MNNTKPTAKWYSFEEMIQHMGYIVYTCTGVSMLPFLRQKKDIVEIRKKMYGRYKKYDVVLYKRGDQYILHRILKVTSSGYHIAGDHCTFLETDIKDENILGVMTRVIRNGKSITPNNFFYKVYVHLWCDFYPIRMMIIKFKQRIQKILSGIKRRVT